MDDYIPIADFPEEEQNKVRWLIRQHAEDLIEAGVAVKYGREWRVDRGRLPEVLRSLTRRSVRKASAA